MEAHTTAIKLMVFALFINLVFAFVGYFGVFQSNNSNTAIVILDGFQGKINMTTAGITTGINQTFQGGCTITLGSGFDCPVLGGIVQVVWGTIILLFTGVLLMIYMYFGFAPLLIANSFTGVIGQIFGLADFALSLISIIYVTFAIRHFIGGGK